MDQAWVKLLLFGLLFGLTLAGCILIGLREARRGDARTMQAAADLLREQAGESDGERCFCPGCRGSENGCRCCERRRNGRASDPADTPGRRRVV